VSPLARREFLAVCACGGAALFVTGCVSLVTHPVPVTGTTVRLSLASFPELAKPDGAIKILPEGRTEPILVLVGASFSAVSPICTHRGCTVDVQGPRLVCPCHGSTYDRLGHVLKGPAERSLTSYRVARLGDDVVIDLSHSDQ
jgi:cytochrome b6-f complex iron-sulfur subunit